MVCPRVKVMLPLSASVVEGGREGGGEGGREGGRAMAMLRNAFVEDEEERRRWRREGGGEGGGEGGEKNEEERWQPGVQLKLGKGWREGREVGIEGVELEDEEEEEGEVVVEVGREGGVNLRLGAVDASLLLRLGRGGGRDGGKEGWYRLPLARVRGREGVSPFVALCEYGRCQPFIKSLNRTLTPSMREWEAVERDGDMLAGEPRPLPLPRGREGGGREGR